MVAIGVTGHRILTDLDKLNAGVAEALRRIEQAFPGQPLTVVSALAEGADRLVVHQVLERPKARLVVPLPLPKADYLADFESAASKAEFLDLLDRADQVIELPAAPSRSAGYDAAGSYVLEHCELLIAIWDGQAVQGRGGTGAIVARARERRLPIAWVPMRPAKTRTTAWTGHIAASSHRLPSQPLLVENCRSAVGVNRPA